MSNLSQASITLTLTGALPATPTFTAAPNPSAPNSMPEVTLAIGDNAFAVPAGAQWLLIQPPAGNASVLKFRTVFGDTGYTMGLTNFGFFPLGAAVATVWLNASAIATVQLVWG